MISVKYIPMKYYDAIIDQMQPYIEEGYITPCKCEYAFKVARRLMIVGTRQEQYLYARKMAQLAIRIWESIPGNKFIDRFYTDEEAKSIKEGMQQRLAIRRTMEELEDIEKIIKYNITVGVSSNDFIEKLGETNEKVSIHVEIGTGMGRTGINPNRVEEYINKINRS